MDLYAVLNVAKTLARVGYHGDSYFFKCSQIYLAPTSNMRSISSLYHDKKEVLTVGGTGALGFEMAIHGAEKIDMFDINILQKMYFEIIKCAIKHFSYEEFITYFTLTVSPNELNRENVSNFLSLEMYSRIKDDLPGYVRFVFDYLYENFDSRDMVISSLFRIRQLITHEYLKNLASFYNKDGYNRLQDILRYNSNIFNYFNCELTELPDVLRNQYDLIMLDNILQYYDYIVGLRTPSLVDNFVRNGLGKFLNDDGFMQVNYGFDIPTMAVKKFFNMPYCDENESMQLRTRHDIFVNTEMRYGINIPLIQTGNYEYEFVPGVEKNDNLVLSYHK